MARYARLVDREARHLAARRSAEIRRVQRHDAHGEYSSTPSRRARAMSSPSIRRHVVQAWSVDHPTLWPRTCRRGRGMGRPVRREPNDGRFAAVFCARISTFLDRQRYDMAAQWTVNGVRVGVPSLIPLVYQPHADRTVRTGAEGRAGARTSTRQLATRRGATPTANCQRLANATHVRAVTDVLFVGE